MALSQNISDVSIEVLPLCRDLSIGAQAVANEIEQLFRSKFIPTEQSEHYFKDLSHYQSLKQGVRVIGPRLTGKSRASNHYSQMPENKAVYVSAPSNCSSRQLHIRLLKAVGHAAPIGKRTDLRPRLAGCLQPFGYEKVIIDNSERLQKEAFEDLKDLMEEKGVMVVLCGTPDLDFQLEQWGFLDCFPNLYTFGSLNNADLIKTLNTIENEYLRLPEPSYLSQDRNFQTLVYNNHAYIGKIIQVVQTAVLRSLTKGLHKIDSEILEKAASRHGVRYKSSETRNQAPPQVIPPPTAS